MWKTKVLITLQAYRILHRRNICTLNIEYECCMLTNHIVFEIWTLNCEWAMLNCKVEYWSVKMSDNSKQQCCKQNFEFWRGYNAILQNLAYLESLSGLLKCWIAK